MEIVFLSISNKYGGTTGQRVAQGTAENFLDFEENTTLILSFVYILPNTI